MTSLPESKLRDYTTRLRQLQEDFARHYPGEQGTRQPVHTVYGGAHPPTLPRGQPVRKLHGEPSWTALPDRAGAAGLRSSHARNPPARWKRS